MVEINFIFLLAMRRYNYYVKKMTQFCYLCSNLAWMRLKIDFLEINLGWTKLVNVLM